MRPIDKKDKHYLPKYPRQPWPGWSDYRLPRNDPEYEAACKLVEDVWSCANLTDDERRWLLAASRTIWSVVNMLG